MGDAWWRTWNEDCGGQRERLYDGGDGRGAPVFDGEHLRAQSHRVTLGGFREESASRVSVGPERLRGAGFTGYREEPDVEPLLEDRRNSLEHGEG